MWYIRHYNTDHTFCDEHIIHTADIMKRVRALLESPSPVEMHVLREGGGSVVVCGGKGYGTVAFSPTERNGESDTLSYKTAVAPTLTKCTAFIVEDQNGIGSEIPLEYVMDGEKVLAVIEHIIRSGGYSDFVGWRRGL